MTFWEWLERAIWFFTAVVGSSSLAVMGYAALRFLRLAEVREERAFAWPLGVEPRKTTLRRGDDYE